MGSSGMGSAFWAAAALLPLVLAYEVKEDESAAQVYGKKP